MRLVLTRKFAYPAISLFLHALGAILLVRFSQPTHFGEIATRPMQIETMGESDYLAKLKDRYKKPEARQLVQTDDRLQSDLAPDKNKKVFLSKTNQIADQNMRAARVGKFKNVLQEGLPSERSAKVVKKLFELPADALKAEDQVNPGATTQATGRLRVPEPSRAPASLGPQGEGFSATDDHIKDIAIGAQTLLNTEEYRYYSFYARIREALSAQWSYRVRQELSQIYASGRGLTGNEKITKVEVRLSPSGKLLDARVLTSSGVQGLDRAAHEAFRAAAPFPHPPRDLIDQNNEVSIKWDFVVYASEQSGVRIQVQRGGF